MGKVDGEDLFVYGTLREDEVVRRVTGRTFPKAAGMLNGFRRFEGPAWFPYPYVMPQAGAFVEGMVLTGVDPECLARLDAYEGACYTRRRVRVDTGGGPREAWVYGGLPEEIERMRR